MKNRINFIDYSKGIGILLVVLGHIYDGNNILAKWIYSFHMPLFFIISGFLLKIQKEITIKEILLRRVRSLIIPYISFCSINIISNFILNNTAIISMKDSILNTITLFGIYALWFLPALFIAEFLFLCVNKKIKSKMNKIIIYICILFCLVILTLIYKTNVNYIVVKFITVFIRSIIALFFINIGYYSYKFIIKIDLRLYQIIILLIINILFANINGYVNLSGLIFNNYYIYIFNSLIGTLNIILISKKISNRIVSFFGKNTLIIMSTHQLILQIIINSNINYINGIVLMFIILFIEYPIIIFINKYASFLLGNFRNNKKYIQIKI